ncbi:MAG: DctP family TRAP transporter solute-binding subunit [Rhodoferax sp.]|uniref:DctP family TRAP transporter solute-binding subunit n=1 Tax=Rhodoferax sp. TaxID=50421 RepID=UPI00301686CF
MRTFIATFSWLALLFTTAPAAIAQVVAPIVIKFSHVAAPDTPKGMGAERFKKLAEERTKGRVRVDIHPNSMLFKDKEELEALQIGAVQMLAPSISKFGPLGFKEFEAFDLPFITPDIESFRRVAEGPLGQSMLKRLESRGIRGLAYWDAGFRVITANRPIRRLADYKGLKIRINSSKVIETQMKAIGVLPQTLAFSEVYQALQTGVVDGAETVLSNVWTQKFFEVQKFVSLLHHTHQAYAIVVNKKFWDGLPPDVRTALESAVADATVYANALGAAEEVDAIDKIKAAGKAVIYEPSVAEREEMKRAMMPVHRDMETRLGRDNIQAMYRAAGFVMLK